MIGIKPKGPLWGDCRKIFDYCIITSDNPRSEEPMDIIMDIVPGKKNRLSLYYNRKPQEAIEFALTHAKKDDVFY